MTPAEAAAQDAADPLAPFRERFALPPGVIYLDGNSLGPLPRATPGRLAQVVEREWGEGLIGSWNTAGWMQAPRRVGGKIAPLIGARPHEVIVADSTSVNLHKLLAGALSLRPGRRVVVSEPGNFPTDLYVAQGLERLGLCELRLAPAHRIGEALDGDVACLMLTHAHYKSAALHDMAGLSVAAHAAGALALWDLSHSAGAVEVDVAAADADLAVGCGYKYLNGGPGAPAFAYVAERHLAEFASPLSGWMGHAEPFAFGDDFHAAPGIERLLAGTPPILGLAALEVGVDLLAEVGVARLAAKSRALSAAFQATVAQLCGEALELASPPEPARRGAHLVYRHPHAYALCQALIAEGVVGDFRAPDLLRVGFAAAYLRFAEVVEAAGRLADILAERRWNRPEFSRRLAVT